MIDRCRQVAEEPLQRGRVVGVEGRGAFGADLQRGLFEPVGIAAVWMTSAPSARARPAVSSPMPALPPITTTVCPASSGSRSVEARVVELVMIPPTTSRSRILGDT
jgi:hypothetical protein